MFGTCAISGKSKCFCDFPKNKKQKFASRYLFVPCVCRWDSLCTIYYISVRRTGRVCIWLRLDSSKTQEGNGTNKIQIHGQTRFAHSNKGFHCSISYFPRLLYTLYFEFSRVEPNVEPSVYVCVCVRIVVACN